MTNPTSGIVREDPPDLPRYDWEAIAADLKRSPGEWFKIFDNDRTSLAEMIRHDDVTHLPISQFEVKTRNNTKGKPRTCSLYLRYIRPKRKGK